VETYILVDLVDQLLCVGYGELRGVSGRIMKGYRVNYLLLDRLFHLVFSLLHV